MKTIYYLLTFGIAVMISACVRQGNLERGTTVADLGDDSVIVMGVKPRVHVTLVEGVADHATVNVPFSARGLAAFPENGYIVGKVSARTAEKVHLLYNIRPAGYGPFSLQYVPCNEQTVTFETTAGKVVYVGDITLESHGKGAAVRSSNDFEAAKRYIGEAYPHLLSALISKQPTFRILTNNCPLSELLVTVIVYPAK